MSTGMFVLLSATLKFGLVFWFGFRELWLLRRLRDQDEGGPGREAAPPPAAPQGGARGPRALPPELVPPDLAPAPRAVRSPARVMEDA